MQFSFQDNQLVAKDKFETVVPQDFRGLYVERDDGYALDSETESVKSAVAAVTRLDQALKASRAEVKANRDRVVDLSPLNEFGQTPQEIAEAFTTKLKEAGKGKSAEDMQRQVEKIKQDLAASHAAELKAEKARSEALRNQLYRRMVDGEATVALAEAQAIDPALVLPFLKQSVNVVEENGEFRVQVIDQAKDIRYSGVTGAPMTINELVAEIKAADKYKPLFKSEAPRGGGAPPTQRTNLQPNATRTATEKIAAGLSRRK